MVVGNEPEISRETHFASTEWLGTESTHRFRTLHMSFPFLPRTVAKRNPTNVNVAKVNAPLGSVPTTSQSNTPSKGKEKAPEGPSTEECAILVSLALSEYALWGDPDLRMKLDEDDGCK